MKDDNAINRMKEDELNGYILSELYNKINQMREITRMTKLYKDECVELAVKDYYFLREFSEDTMDRLMKEVRLYLNFRKM
jgi:hypothetical protein